MMRNLYLYLLTFIVAACSIVYELILSQSLTIGFGGTVEKYSLTIGIFLFALGIGAFFYSKIEDNNKVRSFIFIEIALAICAFLGVFFIFYLAQIDSLFSINSIESTLILITAFIPVFVIGLLSGFELPLLTSFIGNDKFSNVLGVDYFGSLFGTLIYALLLYPFLGLISTLAIFIGANLIVCALFGGFFWRKSTSVSRALVLLTPILLAFFMYLGFVEQDRLLKFFHEGIVKKGYSELSEDDAAFDVKVISSFQTNYSDIITYDIDFQGEKDVCLNHSTHIQFCKKWVEEYHEGLIDVPMSILGQKGDLSVLLIGGGDFIPIKHLMKYDARIAEIDHVDIDSKFVEFAKRDSLLISLNQHAFLYEKANLFINDGYFFLKKNKKKYDLIIFDLPGLKNDAISHIFSKETFALANKALLDEGVLVTWIYPEEVFPKYYSTLLSTVEDAGFQYGDLFWSYIENNTSENDAQKHPTEEGLLNVERYLVLSKSPELKYRENGFVSKKKNEIYSSISLSRLKEKNARPNSIFRPNRDIVVSF